jgi:hypothetical protein
MVRAWQFCESELKHKGLKVKSGRNPGQVCPLLLQVEIFSLTTIKHFQNFIRGRLVHRLTYHKSRKIFRRWSIFLLVAMVAVLAAGALPGDSLAQNGLPATQAKPASTAFSLAGTIKTAGSKFVDETGAPVFLLGVNYEGHTDRAWLLWEDDKYDPALIDADLGLVEQAGLNVVRIFVSKTLRDNINANNWTKLDKVVELAKKHNLRLLIAFNDYAEPNLQKEADFDRKVVARYKGNNTIFGYDLKNEPQFGDIVPADFPDGMVVPLQDGAFVRSYGERMSNDEVKAWRQTAQGKGVIPARLNDQRAYYYANAYKLWQEFLADSSAWVVKRSGKTSLDYIDSPDSSKWKIYLDALSDTLGKYIEVRQGAIRAGDASAITTTGWSNIILAKMAANSNLTFVSLHRFVSEGISGLNTTISLLENLRATFQGRPVVLEEFGYSNGRSDGSQVDQNLTANYETALWLYLYSQGFAGGFKWQLTNYPPGFNNVENNFGLLDDNTRPKPSYQALRGFTTSVISQNYKPGQFSRQTLQASGTNLEYNFASPLSYFSSSKSGSSGPISFSQAANAPFAAWWTGSGASQLNFMSVQDVQVKVNLDNVYPQRTRQQPVKLFADDQPVQQSIAGSEYSFTAQAGKLYRLQVPATPKAFDQASPLSGQLYFKETGHNLGGKFRAYWEKYGGLAINGFPISEEFNENGLTVQYFERTRYEYHPENAGTPYEVLLGHLGRQMTAGREGEPAFAPVGAFTSNKDRLYFKETGHSLAFGFRTYWEKNGGLAQFGYPITEEFQEKSPTDGKVYTVQYFERARFEYHPEFARTPYETLLGHLGWQLVRANGWVN